MTRNTPYAALNAIPKLDKNIYYLCSYTPGFLKDERVYSVLIKAISELMRLIKERKFQQAVILADCLHNLPIDIAEHKFSIPEEYWKVIFPYYRKNCDPQFMVEEDEQF